MIGSNRIVVALAAALPAVPAGAQQQLAEIRQVAEVQVVGDAVRVRAPDQRVQVRSDPSAPWILATDGQALPLSSGLQLLDRPVAAHVSVRSARGRGMLTFIPSPLDPGGALVVEADSVAIEAPSQGLYEFVPDTTGRSDFVLELAQGAVIVDWQRGVLPVLVAGNRVEITGTEASISLDATGTRALAYLREGSMTVTAPQSLALQPGQVVLLRQGLAPLVMSAATALQVGQFSNSVEYLRSDVWSEAFPRPLWRHPAVLGIGAAAVVGVGVCVFSDGCLGGDGGRRTVSVVLRLPF